MEVVDNTEEQPRKFPRLANGRGIDSNKIGLKRGFGSFHGEDEENGESKRVGGIVSAAAGVGGGNRIDDGANQLRGWHHSRIIRVSRASGGKDRHSKVLTSKGLRDRRVRLSVTTAIEFYDLQDRLGFEQPSKAVEWLIKAAADAISELPSLNSSFPETPEQLSGEPEPFDSANNIQQNQNQNQNQNQTYVSVSKSACSSNSETSKGSGLTLSRSEVRVNRLKARERARERAQKEKEKEQNSSRISDHNLNSITQNSSFTELLAGAGGIGSVNKNSAAATISTHQDAGEEAKRQWQSSTVPMDYFSSGILEPSSSRTHQSSGFSDQIHLGTSLTQTLSSSPLFSVSSAGENHLQHISFVPDGNLMPVTTTQSAGGIGIGNDYNLNFTISSSSGLPSFHRGTLQSNSPSLLPHHIQRFSTVDGSNLPFLFGAATPVAPPLENHHHYQFSPPFDSRLQLCYGGGTRQPEQKGKGNKN